MAKLKFNPLIEEKDDGLIIPDVGIWNEEKYRLLGHYCHVFTTSMRSKWARLVYIDIFSGCGLSRIKDNKKIYRSSPLIALSLPIKFDNYIFCEADEEKFESLKIRARKILPNHVINFLNCDCNTDIDKINNAIPRFSKETTTLYFCFADPYDLSLKFATLKKLCAVRKIDFLILLATGMDGNRNFKNYFDPDNQKIEQYLDNQNWREIFKSQYIDGSQFPVFLIEQYKENMRALGYIDPPNMYSIRIPGKNVQLYKLGFFSKHSLGNSFWQEIQKYGDNQLSLNF